MNSKMSARDRGALAPDTDLPTTPCCIYVVSQTRTHVRVIESCLAAERKGGEGGGERERERERESRSIGACVGIIYGTVHYTVYTYWYTSTSFLTRFSDRAACEQPLPKSTLSALAVS